MSGHIWSEAQRVKFRRTMRLRRKAKTNRKLAEFTKEINRDFIKENLFEPAKAPKPLPDAIYIMRDDGTLARFVRSTTSVYIPEEFSL